MGGLDMRMAYNQACNSVRMSEVSTDTTWKQLWRLGQLHERKWRRYVGVTQKLGSTCG